MNKIATIGFFDGVHIGHRFLLQYLQEKAVLYNAQPMVVTFKEHPRRLLDVEPELLTTPSERETLLHQAGIQHVLMLDFAAVQQQTAQAFMHYLHEQHQVTVLVMGYNHRFGSDQPARFEDYQQAGKQVGVEVLQWNEYQSKGLHVSSTAIRKALLAGDIEQANQLLGYRYTLQGSVVAGRQIGREIGFPTANLALSEDKLIPRQGVWVVEVTGVSEQPLRGLLNIGNNPTVGGEKTTFEVHILDYEGDLYDCSLSLHLLHFIRGERKFDSLVALQKQIAEDILLAKSKFL